MEEPKNKYLSQKQPFYKQNTVIIYTSKTPFFSHSILPPTAHLQQGLVSSSVPLTKRNLKISDRLLKENDL